MAFRMTFLRDATFAAFLCVGAAGVLGGSALAFQVLVVVVALLGNLVLLARAVERLMLAVSRDEPVAPMAGGLVSRLVLGAPVMAAVAVSQGPRAALLGLSMFMVAVGLHAVVNSLHTFSALYAQESPC